MVGSLIFVFFYPIQRDALNISFCVQFWMEFHSDINKNIAWLFLYLPEFLQSGPGRANGDACDDIIPKSAAIYALELGILIRALNHGKLHHDIFMCTWWCSG